MLKNHADGMRLPGDFGRPGDKACSWLFQVGEQAKEGGFAGAGATEQGEGFAHLYGDVVLQSLMAGRKQLANVDLDGG